MQTLVLTTSISRLVGGMFYSVRRLHQELARVGAGIRVFAHSNAYTEQDRPAWGDLAVHPLDGMRRHLAICSRMPPCLVIFSVS